MDVGGWVPMLLAWAALLPPFVFSLTRTLREKADSAIAVRRATSAGDEEPAASGRDLPPTRGTGEGT